MDHDRTFEEFVLARRPALLRSAYLLTGDRGQAEDLVQDVLERTYLHWGRIVRTDDPSVYVRRVLVNTANNRWRRLRARVREVPLGPAHDRGGSRSGDHGEGVATRDALLRALAELPAGQRAVVVLRYFEDLSEAETARVLGRSVGTVKSQAARGLARLRGVLEPSAESLPPTVTTTNGATR